MASKYGEVTQSDEGDDSDRQSTTSSRSAALDLVRSMNQQRYADLHNQGFVDEGIVIAAPVVASSTHNTDERQAFLRDANLNADYLYDMDDNPNNNGGGHHTNDGTSDHDEDHSGVHDNDDSRGVDESNEPKPSPPWKKYGLIGGGALVLIAAVVTAVVLTVGKPSQNASKAAPTSPGVLVPTAAPSYKLQGSPPTFYNSSINITSAPSSYAINGTGNATLAPTAASSGGNVTLAPTAAGSGGNVTLAPTSVGANTTSNVSFTQEDWQPQGADSIDALLPTTPGDSAGFSVRLSGAGTRLIVGSPDADNDSGVTQAGTVTIMEDDGNGTWTEVGTMMGTVPEEQFGVSVGMSDDGNFVTIGSVKSEGGGGAVRVYRIDSSTTTNNSTINRLLLMDIIHRFLAPKKSKNSTTTDFTDALSQYADAAGIQFDGNISAYADSLQGAVENVTESGNFSSILDGNTTISSGNLIDLVDTLSKPSTMVDSIFFGDSNNTNSSLITSTNDFATLLTDAATSQGLTFDGNLDSYIEKLKGVLETVTTTENMTSITDGSTTILTADLMDIAEALQNTTDFLGSVLNETMGNITDSNETSLNSSLKQVGQTLSHKKSANGDLFGISTSMSSDGQQLAVGAPHTDGNAGGAFVYKYDQINDDWKIMDIPSKAKPDDYLGWSVAMSGDGSTLAVGAPHRTNKLPGYVDLYSLIGDSWAKTKTFTPKDLKGDVAAGIESDDFGFSVSLDSTGQTLVIGAPNSTVKDTVVKKEIGRERGKAKAAAGYVVVLTKGSSSDWTQMGNVLVGETGAQLGYSVSTSLAGNRIVAGAPNRAGGVGTAHVYQFDELKKEWEMAPIISGTATGADTGFSVSMSSSGGQVSVGSPFLTECKNAGTGCEPGKVQVFQDPAALDTSSLPI